MRISDWSSDLCSSDLTRHLSREGRRRQRGREPMTARPARRLLAGLAAVMLLSGGALAQTPAQTPAQAPAQTGTPPQPAAPGQPPSAQDLLTGGDQPLVIEADNGIEWRRNENVYIARGNARPVRGCVELLAYVLKAY